MWRNSYTHAINRAKAKGIVEPGIDAGDAAHALIAQIEGTLSLARSPQDPEALKTGARSLRRYLESMCVS